MIYSTNIIIDKSENYDITDTVNKAIKESGITEGLCTISVHDSNVAIIFIPEARMEIVEDISDDLERVFSPRCNYNGDSDPEEAAGKSKTALVGSSKDIIIHDGKALIFQRIIIKAFDKSAEVDLIINCI